MTQPSVKKMLGQPLDAKEYPFPDTWSSSLQRDLVLAFCWTVEGLPFRPMKEDHENNWILERQETCTIDVPVVLVKMKQKQSNKQTSVAVALSIDPSQTIPVLMCVKCQVRILKNIEREAARQLQTLAHRKRDPLSNRLALRGDLSLCVSIEGHLGANREANRQKFSYIIVLLHGRDFLRSSD